MTDAEMLLHIDDLRHIIAPLSPGLTIMDPHEILTPRNSRLVAGHLIGLLTNAESLIADGDPRAAKYLVAYVEGAMWARGIASEAQLGSLHADEDRWH